MVEHQYLLNQVLAGLHLHVRFLKLIYQMYPCLYVCMPPEATINYLCEMKPK